MTTEPAKPGRVVVIGGGLAGLTAAYDLGRSGHLVTVVESAPDFGGLASSFRIEGRPIERFYHFICRADHTLMTLVAELDLDDKLSWRETRTAFYHNGRHYSFGTPFDLLRFSAVPLLQRLRFGFHVFRSRYRSQWRQLDRIPAKQWLIDSIGAKAYEVIWHPLLQVKFGEFHDRISAAWIWHRIWRVATSRRSLFGRESFGYLEHGTATLVDRLVEWMRAQPNIELRTGARVSPLTVRDGRISEVRVGEDTIPCAAVISTMALPQLAKLVPGQHDEYFSNVASIESIGVVCMLLSLTRPFSGNFWTNISDPRISFNGIIEQTNLNANLQAAGLSLIYIPFYVPTTAVRYNTADDDLFAEYTAMLTLINPAFDKTWIKEWHVFRAPYAQPVFVTDFAARMPSHRSSIRGLYVTDSTQFYPEDRTISAAIAQGRHAAALVVSDGLLG
jgi:protoporphyrinogen oxidase